MTVTGTTAALTATGLRKSYGGKAAVDGIDLHVPEGSVYALLGPNGAGKTTTVGILTTLTRPDAGSATIGGHDLARDQDGVRSVIGVTGQFAAVDHLLTARENLILLADLHHLGRHEGRRRADALLAGLDLAEAARNPVATFSGGMRRKLDLAMTLIGDPRVLFLDEPTTGLDPRSRRTMWRIIRELVGGRGVTVVLTTQYLEEADRLADRVGVLDGGRLVAEGTPDELKRRVPGGHIRLRFDAQEQYARAVAVFGEAARRDDAALLLDIPCDGGITAVRSVLGILDASAVEATALTVHTPDLDDVFLALTGRHDTPPATPEENAR
ncbi:ATP-binding cassette domain-containing protein [Streptomyces avicenniae]|uniref:ATP-binding cassette domain-containing protein n=1 Tax=Streptomyces avicenniae TaxID=500153 RepID=UPI00069ACBB7|nr:ATP-binding cassette domain-containing protein [Streptomyces avicenniae]